MTKKRAQIKQTKYLIALNTQSIILYLRNSNKNRLTILILFFIPNNFKKKSFSLIIKKHIVGGIYLDFKKTILIKYIIKKYSKKEKIRDDNREQSNKSTGEQ